MCRMRYGKQGCANCLLLLIGKSPPPNVHSRPISCFSLRVKDHSRQFGRPSRIIANIDGVISQGASLNVSMGLAVCLLLILLWPNELDRQPSTNSLIPCRSLWKPRHSTDVVCFRVASQPRDLVCLVPISNLSSIL